MVWKGEVDVKGFGAGFGLGLGWAGWQGLLIPNEFPARCRQELNAFTHDRS